MAAVAFQPSPLTSPSPSLGWNCRLSDESFPCWWRIARCAVKAFNCLTWAAWVCKQVVPFFGGLVQGGKNETSTLEIETNATSHLITHKALFSCFESVWWIKTQQEATHAPLITIWKKTKWFGLRFLPSLKKNIALTIAIQQYYNQKKRTIMHCFFVRSRSSGCQKTVCHR